MALPLIIAAATTLGFAVASDEQPSHKRPDNPFWVTGNPAHATEHIGRAYEAAVNSLLDSWEQTPEIWDLTWWEKPDKGFNAADQVRWVSSAMSTWKDRVFFTREPLLIPYGAELSALLGELPEALTWPYTLKMHDKSTRMAVRAAADVMIENWMKREGVLHSGSQLHAEIEILHTMLQNYARLFEHHKGVDPTAREVLRLSGRNVPPRGSP